MKPLWVDANVLLRLLTNDPPEMAEKAAALAGGAERGEIILRVSPIVVAEMVWVLQSFYGFKKREIADALTAVLLAEGVDALDRDVVLASLEAMATANVDFIDAYLAQVALGKDELVCSFDEDFHSLGVGLMRPGEL